MIARPPTATAHSASAFPPWDVAVVGAGPSGTMTALQLARQGRRVLLCDRQHFPRDKACGDGLIGDSLQCLRRAGLEKDVRRRGRVLQAATIYSPSRLHLSVPGEFITIKRAALDHLLLEAARAAGAVFRRGNVTHLAQRAEGVELTLEGAPQPVAARFAVLATGADIALAAKAGMLTRPQASAVALRCYVRSSAVLDELVVSFDRLVLPGYAWVFPLAGGEYNIGCGLFYPPAAAADINLRQLFSAFVTDFPPARRIWQQGAASPLRGGLLRCGLAGSRLVAGRILAVGETAGTTYPLTGEGIGKALESGEYAARALQEALSGGTVRLQRYAKELQGRFRPRYRGYQSAGRWLSRPWLNDLFARQVGKSPLLCRTLAQILREERDPRAVFSLGGLLRSFFV